MSSGPGLGALLQVMSMHRLDGQCCPAGRGMELFRWRGGFRDEYVPTIPQACRCPASCIRLWQDRRVGALPCRASRRRGVAGLVAVCVLALGVAACSVRDAKAEASASASASASAAIARAEKGIADANASATASREAALTPELRAKRDAALAEPAPAKPPQLNEESAEGRSSQRRLLPQPLPLRLHDRQHHRVGKDERRRLQVLPISHQQSNQPARYRRVD